MSDDATPYAKHMRTMAEGHPRGDELRAAADKLDAAAGTNDPAKLLGSWARAKRLMRETTGEPFMPASAVDAGARLWMVLNALRSKS